MPEIVEVKISSELIKPLAVNKYLTKVCIGEKSRYNKKLPEGYEEFIKSFREEGIINIVNPIKVVEIKTKGKFTWWKFDNGWFMFVTFGMSGQFSPHPGKHICLEIRLTDSETKEISFIYFNDPRHFGTIRFFNSEHQLKKKLESLGWDAFDSRSLQEWLPWIKERTNNLKPIGQLLMDQSIFAGVGNYIRAEALYQAKISPWRKGNSLSDQEIKNLCQAIKDVVQASYQHQGATLLTYKDSYGNNGKYSFCFKVYGKKKDLLGNEVKRESTPEGRTIHWCPDVQK